LDEACVTYLTKILRLAAKDALMGNGRIEVTMLRPEDLGAVALDHTVDGAYARFETWQLGMRQQANRARDVDDAKTLAAKPLDDRLCCLVHFPSTHRGQPSTIRYADRRSNHAAKQEHTGKGTQKNGAVVGGPADREGGKNGSGLALPALLAG